MHAVPGALVDSGPDAMGGTPASGAPSFDPNFLNKLTTESTLGDLPYWELALPETALGFEAADLFQQYKRLPGILVYSRTGYCGTVPRERFYDLFGRQYGVDIFSRRSILFFLSQAPGSPSLTLTSDTPIQKASEACLRRDEDAMYEPLVVTFPDGQPRLVDFRDLILAQTTLFAQTKEAKEQFLATMSHELKTPLTSIRCYAELIRDAPLRPEVPAWATVINESGSDLVRMIDSVLDLSKIDAGRMTLELAPFELEALVRDVEATMAPVAAERGNRLVVDCPADLGTMHADRIKVRQNLFNFLSNACKFTENGMVTLRVARDGETIRFDVSDTGIGMSPQEIERVFQPFVQADSSTTRKYGGSGLGLAIAHHFCALMGGTVSVSSAPGKGATFTMLLPAIVILDSRGEAEASPHRAS